MSCGRSAIVARLAALPRTQTGGLRAENSRAQFPDSGIKFTPLAWSRASHEREAGMRMERRVFLLSVTLAAVTATAAMGQTATPVAGPAKLGATSIPDFS